MSNSSNQNSRRNYNPLNRDYSNFINDSNQQETQSNLEDEESANDQGSISESINHEIEDSNMNESYSEESSEDGGQRREYFLNIATTILNNLELFINNPSQLIDQRNIRLTDIQNDEFEGENEDEVWSDDIDYEDDYGDTMSHRPESKEESAMKEEFHKAMEAKLIKKNLSNSDFVSSLAFRNDNIFHILRERTQESGIYPHNDGFIYDMTYHCVPNYEDTKVYENSENFFCGKFSDDGSIFVSACQDQYIRLFNFQDIENKLKSKMTDSDYESDNESETPEAYKSIHANNVGWSIIDVDFSPDKTKLIYSCWSPYLYMVDTTDNNNFETKPLYLDTESRFCAFSIQFSPSSKEIIVGGSDRCIYIYDLVKNKRTEKVKAHLADVNTVRFSGDRDSNIFYSGGDDGICKVWDRRIFSNSYSKPAGFLTGHSSGITYIDSKGDGRYFISNGKDQTLKLWDIRKMKNAEEEIIYPRRIFDYDYRYEAIPSKYTYKLNPSDQSLATFVGHRVLRTLIRCYFSPFETTGQRYVYTGSFDGKIYIFDVLTGKTVQTLISHSSIVRDCSWHPSYPILYSSGWDGVILRWNFHNL